MKVRNGADRRPAVRALPVSRDQVRNWIDFHIAVIGNAGPISRFAHCQISQADIRGGQSVFDSGG